MKDKKWIIAAHLQTARKLETMYTVIAGKKFAKGLIAHLEEKLKDEA